MGAEIDLIARDPRWLSPLALWAGIMAGPAAWLLDLSLSYGLTKWICANQRHELFGVIAAAALAIVAAGAGFSWVALRRTAADTPADGGHPRQRARFMAILGLTSSALFAVAITAGAIPPWMLDACQ